MRASRIKHLFIVPALLCSPLMTSCNNVVVKEPSFSHYENEITFDEWEHPGDVFEALFIKDIFSFSSISNFSSSLTHKYIRNGKEDSNTKYVSSSSLDIKLQVNSDKKIGLRKTNKKTKTDETNSGLSVRTESSNINATTYYQIESIDDRNYFVEINKKSKIYCPLFAASGAYTFQSGIIDLFNQQYEKVVTMDNDISSTYKNVDDALIKFYLDGSIFTCIFELTNIVDVSSYSTLYSVIETKTERKLQFDFTSKMIARFSEVITRDYIYLNAVTTREEITTNYFSSTFERKTPSIRRVNIKNFDRVIGGVE